MQSICDKYIPLLHGDGQASVYRHLASGSESTHIASQGYRLASNISWVGNSAQRHPILPSIPASQRQPGRLLPAVFSPRLAAERCSVLPECARFGLHHAEPRSFVGLVVHLLSAAEMRADAGHAHDATTTALLDHFLCDCFGAPKGTPNVGVQVASQSLVFKPETCFREVYVEVDICFVGTPRQENRQ